MRCLQMAQNTHMGTQLKRAAEPSFRCSLPTAHPHSSAPPHPHTYPPADLNPLWMAAGAEFTVAGQGSGQRVVQASAFFLGYRKVDLQPHEVLVTVRPLFVLFEPACLFVLSCWLVAPQPHGILAKLC